MSLEAQVVSDFASLAVLEREWAKAAWQAGDTCPTVLPAWSYGLMARQVAGASFHVLVLRQDGCLSLCLPYLVDRRGLRMRIRAVSEIIPLFCPVPSEALFERVLEIFHTTYGVHALLLDHVESGRPQTAGLLESARRRYAAVELRREDANIVVDLTPGWAEVHAGLSSNSRESLKRARSRVERLGLRAVYRTVKTPGEVGEIFAAVLAVDARSWKYVRGGAMGVCAHEHTQFFFAFQKFAIAGQARVFLLELDGRPAAFILAIVVRQNAYMAVWSYDDAFSACSPGRLIMARALSDLSDEGVRYVDFWGRQDAFKASWSRSVVIRSSYTFHPTGAVGPVLESVRRFFLLLRTAFGGPVEQYRLRREVGGLVDWGLRPIRRMIVRRRRMARAKVVRLQSSDWVVAEETICRVAQESDKVRLPITPFQPEAWRVFEQSGMPVACARVEFWHDGTLFVESLWFVRPDSELARVCACALLEVFPKARRLAESRAEVALSAIGGLGTAILMARRRV